ncbi:MAG: hypothetical protein RL528_767 [Bacteroidota bacterium]
MNQNQLREYLFQQDLAHQKEMDKLIRDAQPKKINDDYKLKLIKPPIITRDLITPEYMAEKQLLDLSLDQQMQNMIKRANYAVDGKTPEAMKSSVTDEMIADYKKEVMKPIEIGGKFHLYRPVEIPPIPKPIPKPYSHGGAEITERQVRNDLNNMFRSKNAFEDALDKLHDDKKDLEDKFTFFSSKPPTTFDETARRNELKALTVDKQLVPILTSLGGSRGKSNKTDIIDKIINLEKGSFIPTAVSTTKIEAQLKQVDADIQYCIDEIAKIEADSTTLIAIYQDQANVDEENKLKIIEYENTIKQQAQEALTDFNRLNQGKTQVARQPNESDEDFIQRLKDMGNIFIDPADMEKQIQTEILMKAKKNILELTNDYSKAESVTRMLNNEERFRMNKTFPQLKKKYSEEFGLNNKDLDDVEMTQFIKNEVERTQSLITPKVLGPGPAPAPVLEATPEVSNEKIKNLKTQMKQFPKADFEQIIDELNAEDPNRNLLKGTVKEMVNQLNSADLYDASKFRTLLKMPNVATTVFPAVPTFPDVPTTTINNPLAADYVPPDLTKEQYDEYAGLVGDLFGSGLKSQVFPQKFIFGKIAIDLNKLFYQNILSIKKHNGQKIIGHRNKKVSDNFIDVIFKMIDDKPITQSDLKNIKDERLIYDNLIVQSGLNKSKKIPTTIEQTSQEMKNRLGLLVGEIEAGNSNKKLLEELHELLFKMVRVYLISKSAATTYYNNIKKEFFPF